VIKASERFGGFRKLLIDECHLVNSKGGMYQKFITELEDIQVIGLTATPSAGRELLWVLPPLPNPDPAGIFSKMLYYVQLADLFKAGLPVALTYTTAQGFDRRQLRLNSTGADYDDASLKRYYGAIGFTEADPARDRGGAPAAEAHPGLHPLHRGSRGRAAHDPRLGDRDLPDSALRRAAILESLPLGETQVVVNVGILTTGFDYPEAGLRHPRPPDDEPWAVLPDDRPADAPASRQAGGGGGGPVWQRGHLRAIEDWRSGTRAGRSG